MQLVENQIIKQLMNHPETHEYNGKIYKSGRMLPGTVLVFANIRERKGKFQVICKRDNQGRKIVPQKVDLDTKDDVNTFLSNVYGI